MDRLGTITAANRGSIIDQLHFYFNKIIVQLKAEHLMLLAWLGIMVLGVFL
jgi:hypothetical protein